MRAITDQPVTPWPQPQADTPPQADAEARQPSFLERWRWHLWVLAGLTAFSGFLRFYWIDRPALWNDEAHTFRRMTISFRYLLDILSADGFGPLMYEWYYWLGRFLGGPENLTPFWMRLLPSICGTAMTPAMYFLARQMCSRRTSLLVAAFAACSAYLMAYSHDAKMYMELWLFAALNVACFLWWMRSGLRAAWLAWIATGLAAAGFHAPALIVLGLQPLFFLTRIHTQWPKAALFAAGMLVIASGPVVHYVFFDRWSENVEEHGWDDSNSGSGLTWIDAILRGRDDGDLVRFAASAYLLSWEWPADAYEGRAGAAESATEADPRIRRGRRPSAISATTPRDEQHMGQYRNQSEAQRPLMLQGFCIHPKVYAGLKAAFWMILLLAAAGLLPWPQRWRGASPADPPTLDWGVTALWLAVWVIVPAYYFYIATVETYAVPDDWLKWLGGLLGYGWLIVIPVAVAGAVASRYWRFVPLALAGAAALLLLISLIIAVVQAKVLGGAAAWWQAPGAIGEKWATFALRPAVMLIGLALILPAAWHYSDQTVTARLWKAAKVLLIAAAVYGLCRLVVFAYEYKNLKLGGEAEKTPIWMPRYFGVVWPAVAIALCVLLMRLPTRPLRYAAIALLLGANLAQCFGRFAFGEPPVDHIVADIYGLPGTPPEGKWARGLWSWEQRWKAWNGRKSQPADLRTYVADASYTAHPGGGAIAHRVGRYYISVLSGRPYLTHQYPLGGSLGDRIQFQPYSSDRMVALEMKRSPQVNRLIIWDRHVESPERRIAKLTASGKTVTITTEEYHGLRAGERVEVKGAEPAAFNGVYTLSKAEGTTLQFETADPPVNVSEGKALGLVRPADTLIESLGDGWKGEGQWYFPVYFHWNWSEIYTLRRREYTRVTSPL
jgi:hypothetical protein